MTNNDYISIAKLLEKSEPDIFYKLNDAINIDIEKLFDDFCNVSNIDKKRIIGRPYDRKSSEWKYIFIAVYLEMLNIETIPNGSKNKIAEMLNINIHKIGSLFQKATLFYSIYPDFQNKVNEIYNKLISINHGGNRQRFAIRSESEKDKRDTT